MFQLNRDDGPRKPLLAHCLRLLRTGLVLVACLASGAGPVAAQTPTSQTLTLLDAIELARKNYPSVKESRARATGAQEGVGLARTAYVPRLDVLWQGNRATRNNVFGLLLPQGVVPPISGPVLGTTTYDSVWGSAAGALLSWPCSAIETAMWRSPTEPTPTTSTR